MAVWADKRMFVKAQTKFQFCSKELSRGHLPDIIAIKACDFHVDAPFLIEEIHGLTGLFLRCYALKIKRLEGEHDFSFQSLLYPPLVKPRVKLGLSNSLLTLQTLARGCSHWFRFQADHLYLSPSTGYRSCQE